MGYDKNFWGPKVWYMLHVFSMNNNMEIKKNKRHNYYIFYTTLIYILPCYQCSKHYTNIIYDINKLEEDKIDVKYMTKWVYDVHNIVNGLLDKPEYDFNRLKEDYKELNITKIFFTLEILLRNLDYENMSLLTYDQVYNFFINFCILFPDKNIRKNLTSTIEMNHFQKINSPKQFSIWLKDYFLK